MIGLDELRAIAMALPDVEEGPPVQAARRIAAFKVAGKSFVGVERGGVTMTVSLAEKAAKAVAAEHPDAYEEIWRSGKIFMGLRVNLAKVPTRRVRELIEKSWRHSAPKRIVMPTTTVPRGPIRLAEHFLKAAVRNHIATYKSPLILGIASLVQQCLNFPPAN